MGWNRFSEDHDACGVGFVAQVGSKGSHDVVSRAIEALRRLEHRGGVDADGRSGDGAGLLTALPEAFLRESAKQIGIECPEKFAVAMIFLPRDGVTSLRVGVQKAAELCGLQVLGWREVPTNPSILGPRSYEALPVVQQCFFAASVAAELTEERLFLLRKHVELAAPAGTYVCSLSSRTIVYKGLLTPEQLSAFYPDLADVRFTSPFAIFHQRYSTNTRPSWALAQPFRCIAHNGEINTISGNRRWVRAKQAGVLAQLGLGPEHEILERGVSDSASFDNALEAGLRLGYSPEAAMLRMMPPAWENEQRMPVDLRNYLRTAAHEQEPWDGPAAMVFTDGITVGAKLDRNGLRPLRYTLTSDGLLVVGSEVGIADLDDKNVIERQRLGPGQMLAVNPLTGAMVRPGETPKLGVSRESSRCQPVSRTPTFSKASFWPTTSTKALAALGWSDDRYRILFQSLAESGQEAVWSMGDDAAPAFLSSLPLPLWDYCKQRFAQVTNPPIDPLRESEVMSLNVYLGDGRVLESPVLDRVQLDAVNPKPANTLSLAITFAVTDRIRGARRAVEHLRDAASAITKDTGLVVLSDRGVDADHMALPALLALSAVWKVMAANHRWHIPIIVETGQVIDTHHVALLIAAGASAVFPYAALQQAEATKPGGAQQYRLAVEKGLRKVMARMGISTLASYRNSQLFETLGLDPEVRDEFFEDVPGSLAGTSLDDLLQNCLQRHAAAFAPDAQELRDLGLYRFRQKGEQHASSPELVRRMHKFIRQPTPENYQSYSELARQRVAVSIRDLLDLNPGAPVPIESVESEASVLSRFGTQAMSLGAISPETHRTLSIAMNRLGGRSNTGEGGEDPALYESAEANNRVKQVASARFGVTAEYLVHADELEIKIAQGAKPGEGGQLPAGKVTAYIAKLRHAVPGMTLISPPPHHDIYSIEDLAQLIYDLRAINPKARIGVKLVSSTGVGIIATGVAKAGADVITIAGHDGGTGASALTSIKNTGLPWEVGLRDAHSALVRTGLRGRVRLRADGGLKFARDVIIAALLGADEFGFATAALLAVGCVMARQCHLNTCPVGIATQDEQMRARFAGKPEMVESFFRALAQDVRTLLARIGASSIDEVVGEVGFLRAKDERDRLAVSELLQPVVGPRQISYPRQHAAALEIELGRMLGTADGAVAQSIRLPISNADRAIGAHLTGTLLRHRGSAPLMTAADCEFVGTAGQSFGAFLIPGLTLRLSGEANDYVGKGLCGGSIAISAGEEASRRGDVLAGNTVLYGATGGELYVAGRAGERFAVRNSGALAVVEGVGQHACEYMTAGVAVILGPVGNNFGAGMTGGLAYVMPDSISHRGLNASSVRLTSVDLQEELWLRRALRRHVLLTASPRAAKLLSSGLPLPLMRVEPLALPCPVADTWAPVLKHLKTQPGATMRDIPSLTLSWIAPSFEK
jgi:glutamate synthase domain-containing protein 2/glutamate synthase domain-containing protein 1/glutamate synthase domain-containing protein 3